MIQSLHEHNVRSKNCCHRCVVAAEQHNHIETRNVVARYGFMSCYMRWSFCRDGSGSCQRNRYFHHRSARVCVTATRAHPEPCCSLLVRRPPERGPIYLHYRYFEYRSVGPQHFWYDDVTPKKNESITSGNGIRAPRSTPPLASICWSCPEAPRE